MIRFHNRVKAVFEARNDQEFQAKRDSETYLRFKKMIDRYANKQPKILDIGCGMRLPFLMQFTQDGYNIIGTEVVATGPRFSLYKYYYSLKHGNFFNIIENLAWDCLLCGRYHKELSKIRGNKIGNKEIRKSKLLFHPPDEINLPNNYVDVIITNSVFEHVKDTMALLIEMNRLLEPNGIVYFQIHLFPSLSGGHNEWAWPQKIKSSKTPPWSHVREDCDYSPPSGIFLNRLRQQDFIKMFEETFKIISIENIDREGKNLLTPKILEKIPSYYSKDDLLNRNVAVLMRKTSS